MARVLDIGGKHGQPGEYDFANVSVWNPSIYRRIPAGRKISFVPVLVEWIGQGGRIGGVVLNERQWFNIGSRAEYLAVHRHIAEKSWKPAYVSAPAWPVKIDPCAHRAHCANFRRHGHWRGGGRGRRSRAGGQHSVGKRRNCFRRVAAKLYRYHGPARGRRACRLRFLKHASRNTH